jgi:DNA-binding LacI/PurR family transcriptional regulator
MIPTPPNRPGLRDVARLAGVSHQTVSRVFKGHAIVRASTRDRVLAAAAELDFRPNAAARALATGRSRMLGVVCFDRALFGTASIIAAIEHSARDANFFTSVASVPVPGSSSIADAMGRLRDQGVDGIIVIPGYVPPSEVLTHLPGDLPTVQLGPATTVPSLAANHYTGPREATRHLLELGHHTVHHLPGPTEWFEARERARGWQDALTEADRPVPDLLPGGWSSHSGYKRGRILIADPNVTAVFAANDHIALGLMWAIHEAGRRVPEDVSVIGFDDIPEAAYLTPPLTTVHQDFTTLGRRCVELLVTQITGVENPASLCPPIVPSGLVIRRSTAPRP